MYTPRHASPAVSLATVSAAGAGRTLVTRAGARRTRRLDAASRLRGVDFRGRFIGPDAVLRGFEFFQRSRGGARILGGAAGSGKGGKGQPRPLRTGLDFAALREIHRRVVELREPKSVVAAAYGVSVHTVVFHVKGSASMRMALSAAHPRAA